MLTEAFIKDIPKTDLHVHLDGSFRLSTLIDLAQSQKVDLPSYTEEGLKELVFKQGYADLPDYLHGFKYTCAVLHDPESLARVAYELAWDNMREGVRYLEVRFAPMLHVNPKQDLMTVLKAVNSGLERAKKEFNREAERRQEPSFEYGIIACAMRMFTGSFSPFYQNFSQAHQYMAQDELYGLASYELARAVVNARDTLGLPIVGFDLAGAELGFPAEDHSQAFDFVHQHFMMKTVHAGEAYGPESIFQAITKLHADRIGHGYHLLDADFVKDPKVDNPTTYVQQLCEYIASSRVTLEVCLSSNMDTDPNLKNIGDHPFGRMNALKLSTTLCTDNRLISRTSVSRELKLAVDNFDLSMRDLKKIVIYGFKRSFFPKSYPEKRAYVRSIINYYHAMEQKHGLGIEPVNEY